MTARTLIEHVAHANPEPPGALLSDEETAERDAIRASIMAGEPAAGARRRSPRRRLVPALAGLALLVALVIAFTVTGRDDSFVDRAYAAITAPELFHVVEEVTIDAPPGVRELDLFGDLRPTRRETWYDRGDDASHTVVSERRGGRYEQVYEHASRDGEETVRTGGGEAGPVESLDDPSTEADESREPLDPVRFYALDLFETAYRSDRVRDDGEVVVDGRTLRRLVLASPPSPAPGSGIGGGTEVFYFDPATLRPVRATSTVSVVADGVRSPVTMTVDFPVFERLPDTPENRARLLMGR